MAEKVEIIVTAKDSASQILRGIGGAFGGIGTAIQNLTSGQGLLQLTEAVVKFGKESVEATVAYANEVRNLQQISGQSAEETSRLIQLSDDFKISTNDLSAALRKMTKEGLTLSVETLAGLSDEYLKLNPGQERAAFLMDKFGRQGVKFAEIMGQGSKRIRELNAGIDQNLLLTDEAVKQAREYEKALDAWNEQTEKLNTAFGVRFLPFLTNGIDMLNDLIPIVQDVASNMDIAWGTLDEGVEILRRFLQLRITKSLEEMSSATNSYGQAYGEMVSRLNAGHAAMEVQEQDYASIMSLTVQLGAITGETEAQRQASINQTTFALLQQKLSVDGLTDAELQLAMQAAAALGIMDTSALTTANSINKLTDEFIAGTITVQEFGAAIYAIPDEKTVRLRILQEGYDLQRLAYTGGTGGTSTTTRSRASGGPVMAGEWARVNETNREYFRPATGGSVVPISPSGGGGGMTLNIFADTIIGDKAHMQTYLLPIIREGYRQVQAGR